jgi:hypothetical protein
MLAIALLIAFVPGENSVIWSQEPQPSHPPAQASARRAPDGRRTALFLARRQSRAAVPAFNLLHARATHAAMVQAQDTNQPPSTVWQPVGPSQVSTVLWNLVSGEVTSLAADPSDTTGNTLYPGTAGGGVWKSTNAAGRAASVTFAPLTDNLNAWSSSALTSLSIGAVTVQPGGTGIVLAGTGDPNSGSGSWYGAGVLRSTDAGVTWNLISFTAPDLVGLRYSFLGGAVAGFAWSSTNPNFVVLALADPGNRTTIIGAFNQLTTSGLYYSQDAGATWQPATIEDGSQEIQGDQYETGRGNSATAVVWNPVRQRFYAAIRYHGYYESTDGITFARLVNQPGFNLTKTLCPTNPGVPASHACPLFRGALAVQPITGDMFAWTVDSNNSDQGLWQDTCNAGSSGCRSSTVSFATQIGDTPLQSTASSGTVAQADYDFTLAAVPSQQDTLLFAGTVDLWECSLAGSCVWRNTTNTQTCAAAQVAPAQHATESTFGSTGLLYFGNDAGLWRSTDAVHQRSTPCTSDDAKHFQNLNAGLGSLAEVENFAEDPTTPTTWLAALGDLGTAAPAAGALPWNQVLDGEGDVVAIDPANSQNWYATSESGVAINGCTQGTACDTTAFGNIVIGEAQVENDFQPVPAPWILDPQNTANLIIGTCRVWRGPANGSNWSQLNLLSSMLDKEQESFCDGNAEIRSLAAIPVTSGPLAGSEELYAGMAGVADGGGLIPGHLFSAVVNAASRSSNTKWVDRYSSPVSIPGAGATQFNPGGYGISSIYADPHDPTGQTIYVTIQGITGLTYYEPVVYQSTDGGGHWTVIGENLPTAPANSILVDPNNANIVYVALDTGVYVTQNVANCSLSNQACWNVYGSGLPNAPPVSLMAYNEGETQVLRVATWGRGIWQVDLATAGIAPTVATLQPGSLTFPAQQVETISAVQTFTVTNTGTLNLNITNITVTGDFTETDDCTDQSIALQSSCQVSVTFNPSQTGPRTALLTIFGNLTGGQITAALSGTGLAPATVVLTPSSLTFSTTTVGSRSAAQYVNIANTGEVATTLTSETATGDFSISTNTCTASLAANDSCTVGVVFAPSSSGVSNGILTVVDALGTQTVPLSGTGQSPATDALAPTSLTFAAQQVGTTSTAQQVTLGNNGDQPLTSIVAGATGDFVAVNNCGATLQGKSTCSISVTYAPIVTGPASGTLTVTEISHAEGRSERHRHSSAWRIGRACFYQLRRLRTGHHQQRANRHRHQQWRLRSDRSNGSRLLRLRAGHQYLPVHSDGRNQLPAWRYLHCRRRWSRSRNRYRLGDESSQSPRRHSLRRGR